MTNLDPNRPRLQRLNLFVDRDTPEETLGRHAQQSDTGQPESDLLAGYTPDEEAPCLAHDPVHHPAHYGSHPSGIECIQVVEWFNFNIGNAIKYLWRADEKGKKMEDLNKALWYIRREIGRLENL
jgi:hypothetical protein